MKKNTNKELLLADEALEISEQNMRKEIMETLDDIQEKILEKANKGYQHLHYENDNILSNEDNRLAINSVLRALGYYLSGKSIDSFLEIYWDRH